MSFDDELAKLSRTRRSFLRFASELNPGVPWPGEVDRQYGRTHDPLGDIPVLGTVEQTGVFSNSIANHEFEIEVPSAQVSLFDPDNEWRALADRPSNNLIHRRLGFYVRQHDDSDNILDELIALGQIATPTFPQGKVQLQLQVPGGDFLGEIKPERLLNNKDWPRALPDHLGRVIPHVYGSLVNSPATAQVIVAPAVSGEPCFVHKSTFTKQAGTGQQTIFNLPGTPKAILFWSDNSTAAGFSAQMEIMEGWTDGVRMGVRHNVSADNNAGAECAQSISETLCLLFVDKHQNIQASAAVTSFASGQFTINWTVNDGRAAIIHFMAIGGATVSAYCSAVASPGSPTGIPFTPTGALFLGGFSGGTATVTTDYGSGHGIGGSAGAGKNAVCTFFSRDGASPSDTKRKQRTDSCLSVNQVNLGYPPAPPIAPCHQAAVTAFTSGGITLAYSENNCGSYRLLYLALSGVNVDVGSLVQPSSTGAQSLALPFEPDGLILQSFGRAVDSTREGVAENYFSIGGADGTRQGSIWGGDVNGQTTTRTARHSKTGSLLTMATVTGTGGAATVDAEVALSSFSATGATLNWTTVDATARQLIYIAIGCTDEDTTVEGSTTIVQPVCETTPDGVSDQGGAGRGGWLKGLLVDTGGGTVGISDYPYPTISGVLQTQPHAAPVLAAVAVAGGNSSFSGTLYYAIATVHAPYLGWPAEGGVQSELSNVVAVTIAPGEKVSITWSGLAAGADSVRLFRGAQADFGQFDRYRVSGYPYSNSDLPTAPAAVDDVWPGINTRSALDPDPHWDLNYRKQVYYTISALYADGNESVCSAAAQFFLAPRNGPLSILLSWGDPGAGPSVRTGFRVRRLNQAYHYELVATRQWDLGPDVFSHLDDNTDITSSLPCSTEASNNNKPVYCFCAWTLKQYREVFVLKPDPLSENSEFVQVLMTEGTDYTREIREVNGSRYDCLVFTEQQRSETCQYYEVSANVDGATYTADVNGELIVDADDIFDHMMLNVVLNTYRSSVGPYAPPGSQWFTDVPYAPGLFNRASVTTAKAVSASRITGGYRGSGAIIHQQSARDLIHDLLVSYGLDFYQYRGAWYVKRYNPTAVVRGSLPSIDPDEGVFKQSFEPVVRHDKHFNQIPFFAGPIGGDGQNGYLVSGELIDWPSVNLFKETRISSAVYLPWTQDAATAYDVVSQYLQRFKYPPIEAVFYTPIRWFTTAIASEIRVTHPGGLGSAGWVNRVCRVLSVELDFDRLICRFVVREVDHEVP